MVGIGISAAYGISTTRTSTRQIECIMPATGVLPPFLILAAVRAIAPVAGIPPKRAEPILPTPCATSSIFDLCFESIILSATTQDKRDSIAARIAIVNPSPATPLNVAKLKAGTLRVGSAPLIS